MGTAILIIIGVVIVIILIFAGIKVVMPESFTFKASVFKWITLDMEMKLPKQRGVSEVEASIPPVDAATMTPCELPAAPAFPAIDRDSPPTPTSSSQNAPST